MLETLTIDPDTPRSIIRLATTCDTINTALRLIAIVASKDSPLVSRNGSKIAMAALLTRRSMSPACSATRRASVALPRSATIVSQADLFLQCFEIRLGPADSHHLGVETVEHYRDFPANAFSGARHQRPAAFEVNLLRRRFEFHAVSHMPSRLQMATAKSGIRPQRLRAINTRFPTFQVNTQSVSLAAFQI